MEKRNEPRDWKQQFREVKTIGPEPAMNREGFWKKPEPPKIKFQGEKENAKSDK
jgi:hypothetical protein